MMPGVYDRGLSRAGYGIHETAFGIGEAAKDFVTAETGTTVVGVTVGIFVGEWVGSWLVQQFNITDGWTQIAVKALGKGILSFAMFAIGRKTGGWMRLLLNGASAGSLASILGDVIGQVVAPALAGRTNGNIQKIQIKANPNGLGLGNRTSVLTHV